MKKISILFFALVLCSVFSVPAFADSVELKADHVECLDECGGVIYTQDYTLELIDETNAVLSDITNINEPISGISVYHGTYTRDGNAVTMTVTFEEAPIIITMNVEGNKVTDVEFKYGSNDTAEIAGTYEIEDPVLGTVSVSVAEDGTVSVQNNTVALTGNIYRIESVENTWELTYYDDNYDYYRDWVLTFGNGGFTCVSYMEYFYGRLAGTYTVKGDLGEFDISVSKEGTATAYVPIDGSKMFMSGSVTPSDEWEGIGSVYLSNEFGYELSLYVTKLEDGTLNYSGTFSVITVLAAG